MSDPMELFEEDEDDIEDVLTWNDLPRATVVSSTLEGTTVRTIITLDRIHEKLADRPLTPSSLWANDEDISPVFEFHRLIAREGLTLTLETYALSVPPPEKGRVYTFTSRLNPYVLGLLADPSAWRKKTFEPVDTYVILRPDGAVQGVLHPGSVESPPPGAVLSAGAWDHEHCSVCDAHFCISCEEGLREGYVDAEEHWLCPDCYERYCVGRMWEYKP